MESEIMQHLQDIQDLLYVLLVMVVMLGTTIMVLVITYKTTQGVQQREATNLLRDIEEHLGKLSACVRHHHHTYGDQTSLSTKHWND